MTDLPPRHRILCIRPAPASAAGRAGNAWIEALTQQADVHAVDADFDLDAVCAAVKPDAILLEAVSAARPWAPIVANPRAHPDIPRVLLLDAEPHDAMRVLTMRMAEEVGAETVFVAGEAHLRHMPDLRHRRCFFVPPVFDDAVFRDYGLPKTLPVSVFGDARSALQSPWRRQILNDLPHVFPTFVARHPDDESDGPDPFAIRGERFARLVNQSHFAAADTGWLDVCTHRHLEIPAAGSVLVAPASDALAHCGFVDMENCLLGAGEDLYQKIDLVSRIPFEYQRIRDAGMALVHGRYGRKTWRPILDWLACHQRLRPGQIVQQVGRYGPFRGVTPTPSTPTVMAAQPSADGGIPAALRAARAAILSGQGLDQACAGIAEADGWADAIAEPRFLLGMFALLKSDPISAARAIGQRAQALGALDMRLATLDPVETAWLLLIARLIDNAPLEAAMRQQAAQSRHLSLRRTLWLIDACDTAPGPDLVARLPGDQLSVHWLGDEDLTAWCDLIRRVFMASMACPGAATIANRVLAIAA